MLKRRIIFDDYDTAVHFWTLGPWSCPAPEPVTNLVEVPGRLDGPLDFSTALTGDLRYGSRPLEVRLESSEGTRLERQARIDDMINKLHGQRVSIWLPDDSSRYLVGRLNIQQEYNDLAHAAVVVTATCEPWRYDNEETELSVTVQESTPQTVTLVNGRRPVCPMADVSGEVRVEHKGVSVALGEGHYKLPDIILTPGENTIQVTGSGTVTFIYRKAVL